MDKVSKKSINRIEHMLSLMYRAGFCIGTVGQYRVSKEMYDALLNHCLRARVDGISDPILNCSNNPERRNLTYQGARIEADASDECRGYSYWAFSRKSTIFYREG